jgi:serine/threonine protein kinase
MDYYRLSAMARSEDGCKSRKHIKAILESLYPPIEETSKPLFQRYEDRERKMFFSTESLKSHFENPANIESLLKCECRDCTEARDDGDKLPSSDDSVVIGKQPLLLALMTYLGKLHYMYYWIRWGIVNHRQDHLPVCPDDGFLRVLINDSMEREMFRSAYERALHMLHPVVFTITPAMVCPYLDFDYPNLELDYPNFEDLRFPYQNERLNVTQGFFGVMTKLEIHPDYLDSSVLDRMKGYPRIDRNRPVCCAWLLIACLSLILMTFQPLFALKSVKITAGIPLAKMERDVLNMVSRISEPVSDNFITVIACYKWKQCMHFLFPFIELDLNRLLRQGQCPPGFSAKLTSDESLPDHWLWKQIQGVSRALSAFHTAMENPFTDVRGKVIALHFDLKPANILVTAHGKLKITDFGQSIIQIVEEHGQMTTPYNPGHPRYEPPESLPTAKELEEGSKRGVNHIEVLLNYDVWSLACIMIEVLIQLLDTQTLSDFDEKLETEPVGRFWTENELKSGVFDCLEDFQQKFIHDSDQSQYMKEIIQLLQKMLIHDRHKRAHSTEVVQRLEKAETNFRDLRRGVDPVGLRVKRHENNQWKGFQELGWHNGSAIVPFSEK